MYKITIIFIKVVWQPKILVEVPLFLVALMSDFLIVHSKLWPLVAVQGLISHNFKGSEPQVINFVHTWQELYFISLSVTFAAAHRPLSQSYGENRNKRIKVVEHI